MKAIVKEKTPKKYYDMEYVEIETKAYTGKDKEELLRKIARDYPYGARYDVLEIEFKLNEF